MRSRLPLPILALTVLVLTTGFVALSAHAQPGPPFIYESEVYVKMDFWKPPDQQSAPAWHKDPNNGGQWTQLPNDPLFANPRARFEINRLFNAQDNPTTWVWFLGVPSIKVVRGSPGAFQDVSGDPRYTEMIDRMVFGADPTTTFMIPRDPCGSRIWPIATGSELTPYELSNAARHFGMMMNQDSGPPSHVQGLFFSAAWGWKNPADLEEEDVYIEFTLRFDLRQTNNLFGTYYDMYVSWISAGGGCSYTFCLTPEQATAAKAGTPHLLINFNPHVLVAAVPHALDHTAGLQLYKRNGTQNTLLLNTPIGNLNSHPTSHKCEPDGAAIENHTHASGSAGHLRTGGLSAYHFDPLVELNVPEEVFAEAWFNIPAHAIEAPTDHRALYMLFWFTPPPPDP